ncbi:MAG: hypothetical protein ACLFNX_12085 [Spirochaetaceae bacterium]
MRGGDEPRPVGTGGTLQRLEYARSILGDANRRAIRDRTIVL